MKLSRYGIPVLAFGVLVLNACQTATPPPAAPSPYGAPAAPSQPPAVTASTPTSAPTPVAVAAEPAKPVSAATARNIANNCFTCHGPEGRSPGSIPTLARISADKIAGKLKDFKSGAEPSTVMGRHAKAYTDPEIEAVASYIAGLNK